MMTPTGASSNSQMPPYFPQQQYQPGNYRPLAAPQQFASGQRAAYGSSGPASASTAGRMKTEQVVLEFLYKVAELIIQSRVTFESDLDSRRAARRARFNLDIEEVQFVRDAMLAWKEDVHTPLVVDIYWDGDDRRELLEQWTVVYAPQFADGDPRAVSPGGSSGYAFGNTRDVIQQLKEVCKKISVLLRALHSFIRMLPAHRIVRQTYPSRLSYAIHSHPGANADDSPFNDTAVTSGYSFEPIMTPFGYLKVSTVYCQNCDQLSERHVHEAPAQIFKDNFIIQDYVPGSPDLKPMQHQQIDDYALDARPPMTAVEPRTDSFVPVSDAEQFTMERRRRSSPQSIPMPNPEQQQPAPVRRAQSISQPMAIPQTKKPAAAYEERASLSPRENPKAVQHAHSYGDPERLRGLEANPNVTPAPYGYGNVAISQRFTPPLHQPQHGWMGSAEGSSGGGTATSISPASAHEDASGSYHPLSTPPRHPKTVSLFRNSRTMSASATRRASGGISTPANDFHPARASLDNFTLDDTNPALITTGHARSGGFASEDSGHSTTSGSEQTSSVAGASPYMTPPFMARVPDVTSNGANNFGPSNSLTLKKTSGMGMPGFDASPPFLANPSELLSTSPGYSYSKNYLRTGPSTLPMFVTTNQFRVSGGAGSFGVASGSEVLTTAKRRHFSADFTDNATAFWGISPDSADTFELALVGSAGSGYRQRLLSGSDTAGGNDELLESDEMDMTLPFALGNDSNLSNGTTVTAASSGSGRPSSAGFSEAPSASSGPSWDTASVGNFLHQLNRAPPLQIFANVGATVTESGGERQAGVTGVQTQTLSDANEAPPAPTAVSAFDDELESFRNLRDELAQHL